MRQTLFIGIVENRDDPLKLGRLQVRVSGCHTEDKSILPTVSLPWAMPIQPITSGAISGIGTAPVGLVEGSMVIVMFIDPDQQQPLVLGGIGGIPQSQGSIATESNTVSFNSQSNQTTQQSSDNQEETSGATLKPAMSYTSVSEKCIKFLKNEERLRLAAYPDTGGVWTVGWGTTYIKGQRVTPNLLITEAQADEYFTDSLADSIDAVRKNTKALLTQSMFDSLVSFAYNTGRGNYYASDLRTELNAGRYLDCCYRFGDYVNDSNGVRQAGLVVRRDREKAMFLEDGLPNDSGEAVKQNTKPIDEIGEDGIVSSGLKETDIGFSDPKGVYPLYRDEPDTNRLARHESISKTIVAKKEAARERNVSTANGSRWSQPPIPYNSQYPKNHVYQSESGHVMEFDDTTGSERVHIYHRSGTFIETDANGTMVRRIVGDGFEILERNGYIHINGNSNVTIDGDHNIKIDGNSNVTIAGKVNLTVTNDMKLDVSGDLDISVGGVYKVKADSILLEANDVLDIASNETIIQTGGLGTNVGSFTTTTDLTIGAVPPAFTTGLGTPAGKTTPNKITFPVLNVATRGDEASLQYETPEDGDPAKYIEFKLDSGLMIPDDLDQGQQAEASKPVKNSVKETDSSCDIIFGMDEFPPSLQLSNTFTLGALNMNGARKVIDQKGITKQEIVCNLKHLCINVLEPINKKYPNMIITSGFRRPGDVPNSSPNSDHYLGQAVDIRLNGFNRKQHYDAVQEIQKLVPYSQLILEYSGTNTVWIHVAYKKSGNKSQLFTMRDHRRIGSIGEFILLA